MPRQYFDPESLKELAGVFDLAKAILEARGQDTPWQLGQAAKRILLLASAGAAPEHILADAIRLRLPPLKISSSSLPKAKAAGSGKTRPVKTAALRVSKARQRRSSVKTMRRKSLNGVSLLKQ